MKRRWLWWLAIVAALAVISAAALASGAGRAAADEGAALPPQTMDGGPHGPGMGMGMDMDGLGPPRHRMRGRGGARDVGGALFGPQLARELNLTDAQKEKLGDIRERTLRSAIQAEADVRLARLDLAKMMRADRPDLRAIESQIDRIASLRAGIQKTHVAARLEMRSVLSAEQRRKLRDLRLQGPGPRGLPGGPHEDGEDDGPGADEDPGS